MAIAVGQKVKGVFSGSTGTTAAITTAGSGSVIARGMEWDAGIGFSSITDSKSNVYTLIDVERSVGSTRGRAYYKENAVGGASHTFTGTVGSSANISLYVVEITGALTSGALDQQASTTDAATPFASPSITTTQAAELIYSFLCGNSAVTPATHVESTGFTIQNDVTTGGPDWPGCDATKIVAATGTYNSSFTEASGASASVFIASFKEASAGATSSIGSQRGQGPGYGPISKRRLARGTRSFASAGLDVTVALTGSLITYSAGTLTPSRTVALTGTQYAWSAGTVTPNNTLALTGTAIAYSAGTLAPSADVPLAGTLVNFSAGTMSGSSGGDVTLALTGALIGYSAGTLAPSSTVALTGSAETYATGTLAVNHAQALTGIAEAYSTGVLTPSTTVSIAGSLVSYSAGTLTAQAGGDITVALTGSQIGWQAGTLTASGGDSSQQTPVTGGGHAFFNDYEAHRHRKRRRKVEEEQAQSETDAIQEKLDREIAQLLRAQEARDAEQAELKRIQSLADRFAGTRQPVSRRVAASLLKAQEERTRNALEQLSREIERMIEEEEIAVIQLLLSDD